MEQNIASSEKIEYREAYDEAKGISIQPCNLIKLGLAVNSSVFHFEFMKNNMAVCDLADWAYQKALDKNDELL